MKPKKSALKQRKSNSSAFEKVAPKINAEIVSDSSDFENNQSAESEIETTDLSFQEWIFEKLTPERMRSITPRNAYCSNV